MGFCYHTYLCGITSKSLSITRMNRFGDSGHPCLIPVSRFARLDSRPSALTKNVGLEHILLMVSNNSPGMHMLSGATNNQSCVI